jgi:hypothetical protein
MSKSKSRKRHKAARRSTNRVDEIAAALGSVDLAAALAQFDPGRYQPSYKIKEFCRAERISPTQYYDLRKEGLAPRENYVGRITHRARLEWQDKMDNLPPEKQEALDALRARRARRQLNAQAAAAIAVKSPRHQSNRKRGKQAAMTAQAPARFEER